MAAIAKNHQGVVVDPVNIRTLTHSTYMVEAKAIRIVANMAVRNGWKNVCFEFDSKIVVDELKTQNQKTLRWDTRAIVQDIFGTFSSFD